MKAFLAGFAALLGFTVTLAAQEAAAPKPARTNLNLTITSDGMFTFNVRSNTITYRRNVRATDERVMLECELLVGQRTSDAKQKQKPKSPPKTTTTTNTNAPGYKPLISQQDVERLSYEFEWIRANTNVVITIKDKNGKSVGTGAQAEYRAEKNTIELTGKPHAITPEVELINFDVLVYDLVAESFSGVGKDGITKVVNNPAEKKPDAEAPKAPPGAALATPPTTVAPALTATPQTPPIARPAPAPQPATPAVTPTVERPVQPATPKPANPPATLTTTTNANTNKAPANKLFSAPPPPLKPVP